MNLFSKIKVPHVFTLLTSVVFICSVLTYIIPSGEFKRVETELSNGMTRDLVIPDSFSQIEKHVSLQSITIGEQVDGKVSPVSGSSLRFSEPQMKTDTSRVWTGHWTPRNLCSSV